jgi:hypothetical protein
MWIDTPLRPKMRFIKWTALGVEFDPLKIVLFEKTAMQL